MSDRGQIANIMSYRDESSLIASRLRRSRIRYSTMSIKSSSAFLCMLIVIISCFSTSSVQANPTHSSRSSSTGSSQCCAKSKDGPNVDKVLQHYHSTLDGIKNQLSSVLLTHLNSFRQSFDAMITTAEVKTRHLLVKEYQPNVALSSMTLTNFTLDIFSHLRASLIDSTDPSLLVSDSSFANGKKHHLVSSSNQEKGRLIHDTIHRYFSQLFVEVYQKLLRSSRNNGGHTNGGQLPSDFAACLQASYQDIRPFDDIPSQLILNLDQSLDTSPALLRALALAAHVVNATVEKSMSPKPDSSCTQALTRLIECPKCDGLGTDTVPKCRSFCLNVYRGCAASLTVVHKPWSDFVGALEHLSKALIGHRNAENVIPDIDRRIDDAILWARDNVNEVNKRVSVCLDLVLLFLSY